MAETRLTYLLSRYYRDTATDAEMSELMTLIALPEQEAAAKQVMDQEWESMEERTQPVFSAEQSSRMLAAILPAATTRVTALRRPLLRVGIAAAMLGLIVIGYWQLHRHTPRIPSSANEQPVVIQDVQPGTRGAVLTLGNGAQIILDSASNGKLTNEGNTQLLKQNGRLTYQHSLLSDASPLVYNTLTTARGKQYEVTLPDGTKVWLNAASSLRYPTRFTGGIRTVTLTGEAYFEVAKDATHPFMVDAGFQQIRVLGTSFNINAYADEPVEKTTLLEGAIKVSDCLLQPGQAAVTAPHGPTRAVPGDVQQAIAWKNGAFSFDKSDLPTVMRQLSRWYNVEVEYQGSIPAAEFSGDIGRNLSLSQVLRLLTRTRIRYEIKPNNKILILPND